MLKELLQNYMETQQLGFQRTSCWSADLSRSEAPPCQRRGLNPGAQTPRTSRVLKIPVSARTHMTDCTFQEDQLQQRQRHNRHTIFIISANFDSSTSSCCPAVLQNTSINMDPWAIQNRLASSACKKQHFSSYVSETPACGKQELAKHLASSNSGGRSQEK